MLQKYSTVPSEDVKIAPNQTVLNNILNYSKSLEVKTVKKKKILITLN